MGWFSPKYTRQIIVSPENLPKLVRTLHWAERGVWGFAHGIHIRVFAQSSGNFRVWLTADQEARLREKMREYEFDDIYGPRAGADSDGT